MIFDKPQLNQLYRYCYALTVHQADAYDLLQSSLEKYLKHQNHSLLETQLQTRQNNQQVHHSEIAYLRKIIRNQFIDNARRVQASPFDNFTEGNKELNEAVAIDLQPLDKLIINAELVDHIWSLLNTSEREIIFLWAIEGYTAQEIANQIEVPRGTVLSKIHRLRQKVQEQLAKEEQNVLLQGEASK